MNNDPVILEKECRVHHGHSMCWSAVFSGAFVGVGLAFLLHLYGVAIGLSAYSSSSDGASIIAIGGLLGMLIGIIASMATAGFVAGYLGRHHYHQMHGGVMYGFITWSLILIMSVITAGSLAKYTSAYSEALNKPVSVSTYHVDENTVSKPTVKVETATSVKEVTPKELAWSGWIIFGFFFVGALSSCIGACCGMGCKRLEHL